MVRFGEAFTSLGKISRGEMVLAIFEQILRTNLGGSVPYQFPLLRGQRQFLAVSPGSASIASAILAGDTPSDPGRPW